MKDWSILLVEDNPDDAEFFGLAFAKAGLPGTLRTAEDGQVAVDELGSERSPHTHVLLDLKLPRKSGLEVLAWLRAHPRLCRLPVIVLTSSGLPSDIQAARRLGIDDYLVKPLGLNALAELIERIARRWNLRDAKPV